jgi:hypothetical protein
MEALSDVKIIEKLELERRYWQLKQVPWFLITEHEIDPVIRQNVEWLYPTKTEGLVEPDYWRNFRCYTGLSVKRQRQRLLIFVNKLIPLTT